MILKGAAMKHLSADAHFSFGTRTDVYDAQGFL